MSDVFDEILEKLSPSTIRSIEKYKGCKSWEEIMKIGLVRRMIDSEVEEMNRKLLVGLCVIEAILEDNGKHLAKVLKEIDEVISLKKTRQNVEGVAVYSAKITELERTLKSLFDAANDNATDVFIELNDLFREIIRYQKMVSIERSKYESFENFPADIEQAKEEIAKIKKKIKQNETAMESLFPQ